MAQIHSKLVGNELHIARASVGTGSPIGVVTPGIIGEFYWDSVANSLYVAEDLTDTGWFDLSSKFDAFLELNDTPATYAGQAGLSLQVNPGATALEFGQALRTTDSPTFDSLILTGDLTVQGTTVTLDATTLVIEDKNIELGNVATPSDVTADGGGITLKGTIDKTIVWRNAKDAWEFNQGIDLLGNNFIGANLIAATQAIVDKITASSLKLEGNTLSSLTGDLLLTAIGKVDVTGALKISSGGPAAGNILTSDAQGNATWEIPSPVAGGWTDDGAVIRLNDPTDLVGIGIASPLAKLDIRPALTEKGILIRTVETPGDRLIEVEDSTGQSRYRLDQSFSAFLSDSGGVDRVALRADADSFFTGGKLGIQTTDPQAPLEVGGNPGASVGGFASGQLHVTGQSALEFRNAVITGHNLFNGNTQLWYLGSTSSSNNNIAFINRQNAELHLHTNNLNRFTIQAGGNVGINEVNPLEKLDVNGNVKCGTVIDKTAFAQLNSSVNQEPADTNPTVITYNTQDAISGLTHSTTVNPGEITIDTVGVYVISPQPQVGKNQGATGVDFDMFLQVDRGSGFADEDNSNIKLTIKDQDITDVIVSVITIELNVGDKIRMMQKVSDSGVGMGLKNTDPVVGPPTVPRTPSIIFTMYRKGGLPS